MTPIEYRIYKNEHKKQLEKYQNFFENHWSSKRIMESIQFNPYGSVVGFFNDSLNTNTENCWVFCLNKRLAKFTYKLEQIWRKNK